MKLVRAKHLFVTVTAILSLFVSAVSACACSHHEPAKSVVESSCHGPSHENPDRQVVETPAKSSHVESDCNCFVKTPVPGIVAKTDDKRFGSEKEFPEPLIISAAIVPVLAVEASLPADFAPPDLDVRPVLLSALPSRAPPRL